MFTNIRFEHNDDQFSDVLSFDLHHVLMDRLWAIFGAERQNVARVGTLERLTMWDGEEGLYLAIDAFGGAIYWSAYDGRICVRLDAEADPENPTQALGFEHNWIRFAPVLRWFKEMVA